MQTILNTNPNSLIPLVTAKCILEIWEQTVVLHNKKWNEGNILWEQIFVKTNEDSCHLCNCDES